MGFSFKVAGQIILPPTVPLPDVCDRFSTRFSPRHDVCFRPLIRPLQTATPVSARSHSATTAVDTAKISKKDVLMFEQFLEVHNKRMNMELEKAVPLRYPLRLHESMRHTLMSGRRRLMSATCIASCLAVGGDTSRAMPVACAIEMMTAMVVIHDDLPCMDNAEIRLGKPVNHKAFDEATALLAGDALLCLAFEHLARYANNMSHEQFIQIMLELSSVCGPQGGQAGQMMDMVCEGRDDVGLAELEYIHMHKAGKPVGATVACGAIVGGGNRDEVERLRRFGTKTGFLLQVVDDILDETKTTEEMGKSVGNDSAKGKLTYVKLMGVEGAKKYADQLMNDALQELSWFDQEQVVPLRFAPIYLHNLQA